MTTATVDATVSMISVADITSTLGVDAVTFLQYCALQGIEVGIPSGAIADFGQFISGFRAYQAESDAVKLSSLFKVDVTAVNAEANGAKTEETLPPPPVTDTPATGQWKLPKKGKSMTETVQFLISENDPDYQSGFVQALKDRSQGTDALMEQVANLHYGEMPGRVKRLWTATDKYIATLEGVTPAEPAATKTKRTPKAGTKAGAKTTGRKTKAKA